MPTLALGCYASTELEEADPGVRLRPRVYRPVSGPPAVAGWQDTELATICSFHRVESGGFRCLPRSRGASLHFEDAECGRPVARILGCTAPRFVHELVSPPPGCPDGPTSVHLRIFELEAPRSVERLYDRRDGACIESPAEPGEVWSARRVPDDAFVAAELQPVDDGSERVIPLELRAEDGSRELRGLFDRARGVPCSASHPWTPSGEPFPCMPADSADVLLGGPDCDLDVAPADRCGDPPPLAERIVRDVCLRIPGRTIYEVDATSVSSGDACDFSSSAGYLVREAEPDAVPWLTPTTMGAEGDRLRRFAWQTESGVTWPATLYYDTDLDVACLPDVAPDGAIRCMPMSWLSLRAVASNETGPFADPACTQLAVRLLRETCEEPAWVPVYGPSDTCEGASQLAAFRPVGDRIDAIFQRSSTSGLCEPDEILPLYRAHRLGAPVPFERFAAGEIIVE